LSADANRFHLHPTAARDLRLATAFYRERDPDIAGDFVEAVERAFSRIMATPTRWPIKNGWHRYRLHRFPFTIAYQAAGDLVTIGAVAHHKRRPDYWMRRLQQKR
jgi:toxin ParE1/3/4